MSDGGDAGQGSAPRPDQAADQDRLAGVAAHGSGAVPAAVPTWGVEPSYLDDRGARHDADPDTLRRLRDRLGAPLTAPPLVVTAAAAVLPPGEVVTEGGEVVGVGGRAVALAAGYHRHHSPDGTERLVLATPGRCPTPAEGRVWGWAAQLYATRSAESWGIGDLGDLARLGRWAAGLGAGLLVINPLGAGAPVGTQQPSPYYAGSRRFRSPLYLRVEDVEGADRAAEAVAASAALGRALDGDRVIDRDAVWRVKRSALEAIWWSGPPPADFVAWWEGRSTALDRFATWCALCEIHGPDWRRWPAGFRRPDGADVDAFAATHAARVAFHGWLQWEIGRQLDRAAATIGLGQDLPVGFDPGGFDAWEWQDMLALDVSVGAPPDAFNSAGQDWGVPPFLPAALQAADHVPIVETIRATVRGCRALRIDHVMGLFRLWWIPQGNDPVDGAYVRYPAEELLAIVAIESERAGVTVVGEDLGTVEPAVRRRLASQDVLSYRLLWFEQDPPSQWPRRALAAVTTHDLPTVAGLWTGTDRDEQLAAGVVPDDEGLAAMRTMLVDRAGVGPGATSAEAVVGAHELLARAPATVLTATLEDATVEPDRPNLPGTTAATNWNRALRVPLEEIEVHPVARAVAETLDSAVRGDGGARGRQDAPGV